MFWMNKKKEKLQKKLNGLVDKYISLTEEHSELVKIIEDKTFLPSIIFHTGDLIHYQQIDYQEKYPNNAKIYGYIGTILRHIGVKPHRQHFTVNDVLNEKSSIINLVDIDVLYALKKFNAIMLIELVTTMQGKTKDNVFKSAVNKIINI
ncbi:hypothetical protein HN014_22530 (plasmid) [Aquimarina sp. TRL1]|uniref:hypothetical protein n=1 Tax=Aquimarina sp. (strain TRL1) TaxID=2736252 RepID=UPI00158E18AD|nr:hypothetical protein [Aquimarina sp. TRL1]QKX07779.1 hypothetical protein HN014_22530 [Aquimarina sp. TRL1]